ncbi:MAG: TolC family protein [Pseudomonadota bacterium]
MGPVVALNPRVPIPGAAARGAGLLRALAIFALAPGVVSAAAPVAADPPSALQAAASARSTDGLPSTIDLDEVLRLARERSPRLAVEREAVRTAEARRLTVDVLPNPRVSLSQARRATAAATLFDGRSATDARVEFPIPLAGQRGARVEAAERWLETARARLVLGESVLAEEAAAAFVSLLGVRARIAVLDAALERVDRIAGVVAGREASGLASRYDLARVDVERAALRARRAGEEADARDAMGALSVLLGFPGWTAEVRGTLDALAMPAAVPSRAARDASDHPAIEAARREEAAAGAAVEVARRERWPVPAIGIGRSFTADPSGAANVVGLSVEIPVFDQRRGPLAEAQSEARAAQARRELAQSQVAASLDRHQAVALQRRGALERYDRDALARLPSLETMAEDAYRLGRSSLLEWLDATRTLYEQRLARVELLSAAAEAQIRLRGARGEFAPR